MSALPPKADIRQCNWNVRYGPKADIAKWLLNEKDRLAAVSSEIGRLRANSKSGGFAPSYDYFDLVVDFFVVSSMSVFEPVVVLWPGA